MKSILGASVIVLALRACAPVAGGSGASAPRPAPRPSSASAPTPQPNPANGAPLFASLAIEIRDSPEAPPRIGTLECGATPRASGVVKDAAAACAAVAAHRDVLMGRPSGRACTQIYGGPQEARISGTLEGKPVDRTLDRHDGCGIAEWTALESVLGAPR